MQLRWLGSADRGYKYLEISMSSCCAGVAWLCAGFLQPLLRSRALPGLGGSLPPSQGTKASRQGMGTRASGAAQHSGRVGPLHPAGCCHSPAGTPRTMLKLQAPGEATQDGLGHEFIQQRALKMIKQKNQSLPAQTTVTARLFFFFFQLLKPKIFLTPSFSSLVAFLFRGQPPQQRGWHQGEGGCFSSASVWEKLAKHVKSGRMGKKR